MKRNIFIYCTCLLAAIVLAGGFSGCAKDDEKGNPVLDAFGPTPVLRGGELRFLGKNLDQVTEIILPENISITNIVKVSDGEIKITLPQNAEPGYVKLKTPNGEIMTKTKLTFSEPITIDKFYKAGTQDVTSVLAGDSLVFTGDYLNLIREVVFTDNVIVSLGRTKDGKYPRDILKVKVPIAAQTGKVALSNGENIPILVYTKTDLTVVTASATSVAPATVKAETELTIKGKNLQLVEKIRFNPGIEVKIVPAKDSLADVSELKLTVPKMAQDGDVTFISYSGIEAKAGSITMIVPSVTTIAPKPVKGGATITLTGSNLDLITNIAFPHVEGTFACKTNTGSQVTIDVPLAAGDGNLTLNTNSGKTVPIAFTTVKSTITNINPSTLTAGDNVTITGTNLDLVRSVSFGGGASVNVTPINATSFVVATPTTATSGTLTFNLVSGASVTSSSSLTVLPSTNPVITTMPLKAMPGDEITLNGNNLNTVESIYFGTVKVTSYSNRTASSITLTVPDNSPLGSYKIKMENYSGATFYSNDDITVTAQEPILPTDLIIMDFEQHGGHNGSWDASWSGVTEIKTEGGNTYSRVKGTVNSEAWILNCNHQGNGAPAPIVDDASKYVLKVDIKTETDFEPGTHKFQVVFHGSWSGSQINNILPMKADGKTCSTRGQWITVTLDLAQLGYTGRIDLSSETYGLYLKSGALNNAAGLCFDNLRFSKK